MPLTKRDLPLKTIASGTKGYPATRDVYKTVLTYLLRGEIKDATFERVINANWLKRQLLGDGPSVAVALVEGGLFELTFWKRERNFRLPARLKDPATVCRLKGVEIPQGWLESKQGKLMVPVSELQVLVKWLDDYFITVLDCPPKSVVTGTFPAFDEKEEVSSKIFQLIPVLFLLTLILMRFFGGSSQLFSFLFLGLLLIEATFLLIYGVRSGIIERKIVYQDRYITGKAAAIYGFFTVLLGLILFSIFFLTIFSQNKELSLFTRFLSFTR